MCYKYVGVRMRIIQNVMQIMIQNTINRRYLISFRWVYRLRLLGWEAVSFVMWIPSFHGKLLVS